MRQSLIESIDKFKSRFANGFHDAHFLSIEYNFHLGYPSTFGGERISVKISTPDWKEDPNSRPPKRIVLLFEMEGVIDYLLLRKQENRYIAKIDDIDVILDNDNILIDFLPYFDTNPLRGRPDIYKHYEKEETGSLFVVKGKQCYWSIIE